MQRSWAVACRVPRASMTAITDDDGTAGQGGRDPADSAQRPRRSHIRGERHGSLVRASGRMTMFPALSALTRDHRAMAALAGSMHRALVGSAGTLRAFRHHPPARVLRVALGSAVWTVAASGLRTRTPPSLTEFFDADHAIHLDAVSAASALCPTATSRQLTDLCAEHAEFAAELTRRYDECALAFPKRWTIERGTSLLLYLLVRLRRPKLVLETGVADGHSSAVLLRALARNGAGVLHSADVRADVGVVIPDSERAGWMLHQLHPAAPEASFRELVTAVAPIDLFFHDSHHSYLAQRYEYETVLPAIAPGGLLASDDVHMSHAFIEFAAEHGVTPQLLVDTRKLAGVMTPSS